MKGTTYKDGAIPKDTTKVIPTSAPYFDLGDYRSQIVRTNSTEANIWFHRGLIWAYGFNHDEAILCFEQALKHDSDCLMAYWGIAYCSGPHYNKSWSAFDRNDFAQAYARGTKALQDGEKLIRGQHMLLEEAIFKAVKARFPDDPDEESLEASNGLYADAMRKILTGFPDDEDCLDNLVLVIDALMNIAPWRLFEARTGLPNKSAPVVEIGELLARAMKHEKAKDNPGLLHLYIHYSEMSSTPEVALAAADRLRYLVPDSGHLQHMPSHIYMLVGDYRQAMDSNFKASIVDDKYWTVRPDTMFYTVYRLHNFHSLIYAAMMAGQSKLALETCDRMEAALPESILKIESPPMADWNETYFTVRAHILIRFGMWAAIKAMPLPKDNKLYSATTAFIHYAKAIAAAATGDLSTARSEKTLFKSTSKLVPESRLDFPNTIASELLIADAMLDGELAYREGHYDEAFKLLQLAISRDDGLVYSEPWGWQVPTRHAYAALLLEQNRLEDAAIVYAQDLGLNDSLASAHQHPGNIWSLTGYHECLRKLGRNREAAIVNQQLKVARAIADVDVQASCACSAAAGACGSLND